MGKKKKAFVCVIALLIIATIIFNSDIPNKVYAKKFLNIDIEKAKGIKNNIPEEVLESIDKNRITTSKRAQSIGTVNDFKKEFLYKYENLKDVPNYVEVDESKKGITVGEAEAIEDIGYMFKSLKYGYAGYQYFGGDEKIMRYLMGLLQC